MNEFIFVWAVTATVAAAWYYFKSKTAEICMKVLTEGIAHVVDKKAEFYKVNNIIKIRRIGEQQ